MGDVSAIRGRQKQSRTVRAQRDERRKFPTAAAYPTNALRTFDGGKLGLEAAM